MDYAADACQSQRAQPVLKAELGGAVELWRGRLERTKGMAWRQGQAYEAAAACTVPRFAISSTLLLSSIFFGVETKYSTMRLYCTQDRQPNYEQTNRSQKEVGGPMSSHAHSAVWLLQPKICTNSMPPRAPTISKCGTKQRFCSNFRKIQNMHKGA